MTCLPCNFNPQFLVELNMTRSKLEKLWDGSRVSKKNISIYLTFYIFMIYFELYQLICLCMLVLSVLMLLYSRLEI